MLSATVVRAFIIMLLNLNRKHMTTTTILQEDFYLTNDLKSWQ